MLNIKMVKICDIKKLTKSQNINNFTIINKLVLFLKTIESLDLYYNFLS